MNSIFDYDYIEGSDHFEQIDQIEGRYRVVSGQQEVIEGMQCSHVKFSVKKNMASGCVFMHMGQFLQGGKNGRLMSFFFKSRASV